MSIFHNNIVRRKFKEIIGTVQTCLRSVDTDKKSAFSMMEMLIVMLIVSVVMAMYAPTVVKKKVAADKLVYEMWTPLEEGDIAWNIHTDDLSAIIGGDKAQVEQVLAESTGKPRLVVSSPGKDKDNSPENGFKSQLGLLNVNTGTEKTASAFLRFNLGYDSDKHPTIAIGSNIPVLGANTVSIGYNQGAVKGGTLANTTEFADYAANITNSVVIGSNHTMWSSGNKGTTIKNTNNVLIGSGGYMGYCHKYWYYKKKYLKEIYGIDWKSPAELNPNTIFD